MGLLRGERVNSQFWIHLWCFEGCFQWARVLERIKIEVMPTSFPCKARRTRRRMRSFGPRERNNINWCLSLTQGKERKAFNPALGRREKVDQGTVWEKWKTILIWIVRGVCLATNGVIDGLVQMERLRVVERTLIEMASLPFFFTRWVANKGSSQKANSCSWLPSKNDDY